MILNEDTFNLYGYSSAQISNKSNKKVVAKCDSCGRIRTVLMSSYRDLCHHCCYSGIKNHNFGKPMPEETRKKIGNANRGRKHTNKTKEKLHEIFKNRQFTLITRRKISNSLKGRHPSPTTIEKLRVSHQGERAATWKGGISFEPYCPKFTKEFKERVRAYFKYQCVLCNKTQEQNGHKLHVHHVNYNKQSCCDGSPPLFAALCRECHAKTTISKRDYWRGILTKILNDKYSGKCYFTKEEIRCV